MGPGEDLTTTVRRRRAERRGAAIVRAVGERSLAALVLRSWSEMTSDDAISQWAFAGLAAHAIKAHAGGKSAAKNSMVYPFVRTAPLGKSPLSNPQQESQEISGVVRPSLPASLEPPGY